MATQEEREKDVIVTYLLMSTASYTAQIFSNTHCTNIGFLPFLCKKKHTESTSKFADNEPKSIPRH